MAVIKYGGGPNPPVRLDKWQNIIGVGWGGGEVAAYIACNFAIGSSSASLVSATTGEDADPDNPPPNPFCAYITEIKVDDLRTLVNDIRTVSLFNAQGIQMLGSDDVIFGPIPRGQTVNPARFEFVGTAFDDRVIKTFVVPTGSPVIADDGGGTIKVTTENGEFIFVSDIAPALRVAVEEFEGSERGGFNLSSELCRWRFVRTRVFRPTEPSGWEDAAPYGLESTLDFSEMRAFYDGHYYNPVGVTVDGTTETPIVFVLMRRENEEESA
jgi:hypothetical protein